MREPTEIRVITLGKLAMVRDGSVTGRGSSALPLAAQERAIGGCCFFISMSCVRQAISVGTQGDGAFGGL